MSHDGWSFWDDYEERNSEPNEKPVKKATTTLAKVRWCEEERAPDGSLRCPTCLRRRQGELEQCKGRP